MVSRNLKNDKFGAFLGFKAKYNLVRHLQLVLSFTYCLAKLLPRFSPNFGHVGKI